MSELKYPHLLDELDKLFKKGRTYNIRRIAGCAAEVIRNTRHSEWVSVDDRLPEDSGRYLIVTKDSEVAIDTFLKSDAQFALQNMHKATHWQPLPEPPKGGDDAK